jgi:hypothetical protein
MHCLEIQFIFSLALVVSLISPIRKMELEHIACDQRGEELEIMAGLTRVQLQLVMHISMGVTLRLKKPQLVTRQAMK